MGWSSERREVLEIGIRCGIDGQLQRGDEDTTPFHKSITIFSPCLEVPRATMFCEVITRMERPLQSGSMDLPVASDHNFKLLSVQIDH